MSKSEMVADVRDLIASSEQYINDEQLIRARIEMRHKELNEPDEEWNLDDEVQRMIDFALAKNERNGARRENSGIPGEIASGAPVMSAVAEHEPAHELHLKLSRSPIFDVARVSTWGEGAIASAEAGRKFVSPEVIGNLTDKGLLTPERARAANTVSEVSYAVMMAAAKQLQAEMPGVTRYGGELFNAVEAIGDLFPNMIVRLWLRTVQYALLTGVDASGWESKEGLMVLGDLITELGSPVEPILLLSRRAQRLLAERMDSDDDAALVRPYFETLISLISTAATEGRKRYVPAGAARLDEGWRDRWKELPLREYWDDPELVDLPEKYKQLLAKSEAERDPTAKKDFSHPLENPDVSPPPPHGPLGCAMTNCAATPRMIWCGLSLWQRERCG